MIWPWALTTLFAATSIYLLWERRRHRAATRQLLGSLRGGQTRDSSELPYPNDSDLGQLANKLARIQERSADLKHEVKSADRLFRTVVQELVDGLILVHPNLAVTFYNKRAEVLFPRNFFAEGSALIEVCGNKKLVEHVQLALDQDAPQHCEISIIEKQVGDREKRRRHYVVETAPLGASVGGGAWVLIRDITEQIQTEQVRKDFVANASHELRTPLTLINGYIETLQTSGGENPELRQRALGIMGKHGDRLALIIEDMLTISKLEDAPTLSMEPFDMGECVASVVENLVGTDTDELVKIAELPLVGRCPVIGDRFFWDQILINLVGNAIKQNPSGVGIGISWEKLETKWTLRVWDDGVGISRSHLPFIFKRFYRAEKHHSESGIKGTGLGLSIVKRAVEAHGGSIQAESTPGERTEFVIEVPLSAQPRPGR